jgi:transposase InsO family protein
MLLVEIELDAQPPAPAPTQSSPALQREAAAEQRTPERALVLLNEEKAMVIPGRADKRPDSTWYLDTGASNHMTGDRATFSTPDETITGNARYGSVVQIKGRGTIVFCIDGGPQRAFSDVYFIPKLKSSIVSLGQLDELACDIRIRRGVLTILDRRDKRLLKVKQAPNRLYKLTRNGMVRGLLAVEPTGELCEACLAGKQRRTPFPQQAKFRAEEPLELVHADLCGAITPPTPAGRRYFLLLVDDHSRFMWLVLLSTKDEAAAALKRFQAEAQTEARRQLCTLRRNHGGEFTSSMLAAHFANTGVKRHLTASYSPQQNGVVERRNQTMVGMARSMIEGEESAKFLLERGGNDGHLRAQRSFTRSAKGRTPYEAWYGKKPSVEHLRVFGCVAHVKSARPLLRKLDDRSTPMIFIGYEPGSKAYRVYNPVTRRVHISRDVVFDEGESWDWSKDGSGAEDLGEELVVEYTFAPNPT